MIQCVLTLDEDGSVTESALGFTDGPLKVFLEALLVSDDSHTSSSTTHGSFDDDWEAVFFDEFGSLIVGFNGSRGTGDDWDAGFDSEGSGFGLVSQGVDGLWSGTDEGDACVFNLFGKLGIFG